MKQAIGAILLVVGTLAAVGYMAAHLFMQDPIPAHEKRVRKELGLRESNGIRAIQTLRKPDAIREAK